MRDSYGTYDGSKPEPPYECLECADLAAKLQAAEAELEEAKSQIRGMFRQATLFLEKLTDCESALHKAEDKNQELIKDYAEWMSPEDYVPLAQERDRLRYALEKIAKVGCNCSECYCCGPECMEIAKTALGKEIPESGGHLESTDCWCGPTVEEHPGGTLVIHNQTH